MINSSCGCVKIDGPAKREKVRVQCTYICIHLENLRVLPLSDQILSVLPASSRMFFKRSQSVHLLKGLVGEITVACCNTGSSCGFCFVSAVSFSSPPLPLHLSLCVCGTYFKCVTNCCPWSLALRVNTHTTLVSYIRRGGILENHQNLCHRNLTCTWNGYIGHFILSEVESKCSESSSFIPQANRLWPSVLGNSSLAGIPDQGAVSFQGA